jgi:hypothetical protein
MSLILDGTNGLSDVDGTAAAPAIRGTDANTGIFFGTDIIGFSEGGAEAARINSSGQLDLVNNPILTGGTANGVAFLNGSKVLTTGSALAFDGTTLTGTASGALAANFNRTTSSGATVKVQVVGNDVGTLGSSTDGQGCFDIAASNFIYLRATGASQFIKFETDGSERARIDASGNFLSANGAIYFTSAQYRSNVASSQLQFINNSAGVSLAVNGTSWGSLSDERDKEIIEPITDAVSKVSSLRSVIGRYKVDDADKRRAFLIAQDVKAVLPEAVTELDDEQKTLILQYTEVIPLLVAAIKEQQALITALTTRITALEGAAA